MVRKAQGDGSVRQGPLQPSDGLEGRTLPFAGGPAAQGIQAQEPVLPTVGFGSCCSGFVSREQTRKCSRCWLRMEHQGRGCLGRIVFGSRKRGYPASLCLQAAAGGSREPSGVKAIMQCIFLFQQAQHLIKEHRVLIFF